MVGIAKWGDKEATGVLGTNMHEEPRGPGTVLFHVYVATFVGMTIGAWRKRAGKRAGGLVAYN